jgi:hypothetical protein
LGGYCVLQLPYQAVMMKKPRHKSVPTKIKQLAEKRARTLGRLLLLQDLETELTKSIPQLTLQLQQDTQRLEFCKNEKRELASELEKCDEALVSLNPTIDPSKIAPIRRARKRYGAQGSLIAAVLNVIETAHPQQLTTIQIADAICLKFQLVFAGTETRYKWEVSSLKTALDQLFRAGKIEKGEKVTGTKGVLNRLWCFKVEAPMRLCDL